MVAHLPHGQIHLPLNRQRIRLKNRLLIKHFVFHPILMKVGEVVVHMGATTTLGFIKIG